MQQRYRLGLRAAGRLLLVHLNSERTVEAVRQDGSFAEKQRSYRALVFLVQLERLIADACETPAADEGRQPTPIARRRLPGPAKAAVRVERCAARAVLVGSGVADCLALVPCSRCPTRTISKSYGR
jgi:hypothetical protein